ncbi:MAG: L,D-transpeptidase, partial [Candidatus Kapabacteria bacterium]|nr:L,D-transpeptidase [Candidatus Kapabacteria bacterium]
NHWDWRYRYNAQGEREQKRLYHGPLADSIVGQPYPWVQYLLGGSKEQLAVWHGQQMTSPFCDTAWRRNVFLYPTEYLSYGAGKHSNVVTRPDGAKEYRFFDHLGSSRAVLGSNGFTYSDYAPFGGLLAGGTESRKGFIGKEKDGESDLRNLGVRQYDDEGGRFLSVDAFWESNRYTTPYHYSRNNPTNRIDGSGLWDIEVHFMRNRGEEGGSFVGVATLKDRNGKEIYSFIVRGQGEGRDRMHTDHDTPAGVYDIDDKEPWTSGGSRASYGPNPRLVLTGESGEIKESGRTLIRIHGGQQEVYNEKTKKWEPAKDAQLKATHGCLRTFDEIMKELKEKVKELEDNDSEEKPGKLIISDDIPVPGDMTPQPVSEMPQ